MQTSWNKCRFCFASRHRVCFCCLWSHLVCQGKYQYAVYYIREAIREIKSPNFERTDAINNRIVTWDLQHVTPCFLLRACVTASSAGVVAMRAAGVL